MVEEVELIPIPAMQKQKRKKGYIKVYEDRPIRTLKEPVWESRTKSGLPVILSEKQAKQWTEKTGMPVKMRLKKYELDEL